MDQPPMMLHTIRGVRALVYHQGKLLVVKRSDKDIDDPGLWDLPGGSIETGESVPCALMREVVEETGLNEKVITISDLHGFIMGDPSPKGQMIIAVYICQSSTAAIVLNEEHSEYRWIKHEEILAYPCGRILQTLRVSIANDQ